jgi:pseudolysin
MLKLNLLPVIFPHFFLNNSPPGYLALFSFRKPILKMKKLLENVMHITKNMCIGVLLSSAFLIHQHAYAAKALELRHQPLSVLGNFFVQDNDIKTLAIDRDFNHVTHVRVQQTFKGYPVHGGEAVVHLPSNVQLTNQKGELLAQALAKQLSGSMNGVLFQGLQKDLAVMPLDIFSKLQLEKALQHAIQIYRTNNTELKRFTDSQVNPMVFVDKNAVAHWAFKINFIAYTAHQVPKKPSYIMDAMNFEIYQAWDDMKTLHDDKGGGYGGNEKIGKSLYDGIANDYPYLDIQRDDAQKICYLKNKDVTVKDIRRNQMPVQFVCPDNSQQHGVYWDADFDAINGAYSPSNDALFIGKVVKEMYQQWFGIPVLQQNGKPMMLNMLVHEDMENALWNGGEMVFGDGGKDFYPLVSLGVGAHEIAHGFTEQHANLEYYSQSGGLNESFSDMAAKAAEFYAYGHHSWEIGSEIIKASGGSLRYLDEPTKDCLPGDRPGDDCSISQAKDYHQDLNVHYSSGVFNKAFSFLSTTPGWDTHKAFSVMVKANMHYWTSTDNFAAAACGVLDATKDYGYDTAAVTKAMAGVGIKTIRC